MSIPEYNNINPKFSSDFGYLKLLDDIIKITNGWLMSGNYKEYYLCLESWYLTVIERLERNVEKNKHWGLKPLPGKSKPADDANVLHDLRKLRGAARSLQHGVLTKYHEELERLTAKAQLRLRDETAKY